MIVIVSEMRGLNLELKKCWVGVLRLGIVLTTEPKSTATQVLMRAMIEPFLVLMVGTNLYCPKLKIKMGLITPKRVWMMDSIWWG